jgi:hypothetical protein
MSSRLSTAVLVLVAALAVTACAHTRVVKSRPGKGGEIMVSEGLFGDARADAKKKMRANCGSRRPEITEEGEAVVGKRRNSSTDLTKWGSVSSEDEDDKTEWRLKYRCT